MHGVKRSEIIDQPLNDEEIQKIESYKRHVSDFNQLYCLEDKTSKVWVMKMMEISQQILIQNPEYYTVWNERKRAIQLSADEVCESFMKQELMISVLSIKANPKSYSAWYHRRWFLSNFIEKMSVEFKEEIIQGELKLLDQLLSLDCRNFHGWNYRIWLADWAGLSVIDEFDFTTVKIYQNFSNYSAWQRRAHLLPKFLASAAADSDFKRESILRNEVEMCRNAAWTEPSDQSIWFYQKWLFSDLPILYNSDAKIPELMLKLAKDQLKSVQELIGEEKRQFQVALAMSFVIFLYEKVFRESNVIVVEEFREALKNVDKLRQNHYSNSNNNNNKNKSL